MKKSVLKRKPVSPLKRAKREADKAFSLYIRSRDGRCMLAGLDKVRCGGVLQCMHLRTRGDYGLRYDEVNALTGCQGHHVFYTNHPSDWDILLEAHFHDRWEYIHEHRDEHAGYKLNDYEEFARWFTSMHESNL